MVKSRTPEALLGIAKRKFTRLLKQIPLVKDVACLVVSYMEHNYLHWHLEELFFMEVNRNVGATEPNLRITALNSLVKFGHQIESSSDPILRNWTQYIYRGMYFVNDVVASFLCVRPEPCGCNYSKCYFDHVCSCGKRPLDAYWIKKRILEARQIKRRKDRRRLYN